MKIGIISILLAVILVLIPYLSALTDSTRKVTITMNTESVIGIALTGNTNWNLGIVSSNEEKKTNATWCT